MSLKTELELDPSKAISQAGDAANKIGDKMAGTKMPDIISPLTAKSKKALDEMGGKTGNAGYGLQKVAQFADDAQYGLKGVTNNISDTLMSLGAGAGLAGAATIAAVAINSVLVPGLEKFYNVESDAERATRMEAAALRDSEQASRRKADATKAATKATQEANATMRGELEGVRSLTFSYDEAAKTSYRFLEAKSKNASLKIDNDNTSDETKIRAKAKLESDLLTEKVRLEKVSAEASVRNADAAATKLRERYEATSTAIARAEKEKKINFEAADTMTPEGGRPYRLKAESAEKEAAALKAKLDVINKEYNELETLRDSYNARLKEANQQEKLSLIEQENIQLESAKKIKDIGEKKLGWMSDNLLKETKLIEKSAIDTAKEINKAQEQNNKALEKRSRDNEIAKSESAGKKTKTERLKREAAIEDESLELRKLGMDPAEARKQAEAEVRTKEDADYRRKTGRSRAHGINTPAPQERFDPNKRMNDGQFANLDRIERMQTDPNRNAPTSSLPEKPKDKDTNASQAEVLKSLKELINIFGPAAKKFTAESLRTAS